MATTIEECDQICQAVSDTGLKYMMAETVVYSREFLFIKEMYTRGELGKIQYMAASHPQDMDGWPEYWERMIPMHYATHVVSPVLGLVNGRAEYVSCFGSGAIRPDWQRNQGIRSLSNRAISRSRTRISPPTFGDSFSTLPDSTAKASMSMGQRKVLNGHWWRTNRMSSTRLKKPEPEIPSKVEVPDYAHLLPPEIREFTRSIQDAEHLSFVQGGGHGGSHPHLVNEFLNALSENRDPWPNATTSANWTCVGLCAHQSAVQGGQLVRLPDFTLA